MLGKSTIESDKLINRTMDFRFVSALSLLLTGYVSALIGGIAFFKIPLVLTFGMVLVGVFASYYLPTLIDKRFSFAQVTRVFTIVGLLGSLTITALMILFAGSDWSRWYVHPAGFHITWFVLVTMFFHIATIRSRMISENPLPEIVPVDYDAEQNQNPYAPPMKSL